MGTQRSDRFNPTIHSFVHFMCTRFEPTTDPAAFDLLEDMLIFNPAKRITITAAMKYRYFDGLGPI